MKLEEAIAKAKILIDSLKELTDEYEGQGSFIAAGMAVSFKLVLDTILTALRPVSRERLSGFKTCDLVGELRKREGVEAHIAEQYQDVAVSVNGPAVVLVVMD